MEKPTKTNKPTIAKICKRVIYLHKRQQHMSKVIDKIERTLERNTHSLEEHMRRTVVLEKQLKFYYIKEISIVLAIIGMTLKIVGAL